MNIIIDVIKEHIEYRTQIFKLAKSDMIRTYRGAALGWLWAIIKPVITIFVYWFAFTIGLRGGKPINGYPFFLWLTCGIIPWFYMNEMLTQGTNCIRKYDYLVTKMKFPVSTIPTFVSISKIFINLCLIILVILLFWIFGYPPSIYLLQLPFYILCSFIFFTILTLFTSPLAAMSKDFSNLIRSIITAIFWLSGILWEVDKITIPWLKKLLMFNPVTFVCTGFRNCFIYQTWFFDQSKRLGYFVIVTTIMFILSIFVYKKFRKEIPDVL